MKRAYYRSVLIFMMGFLLASLPVVNVATAAVAKAREMSQESASSTVGAVQVANISALNNMMLEKMNQLRASVGAGSLVYDDTLNSYAGVRSVEASTKWSHTRPDGSQGCDMIPPSKWRGENLSYVTVPGFSYSNAEQAEAAQVMFDNLVASPTHYDNMTFGSFTKVGIRTNVMQTGDGTRITTAYLFSS